MRSAGRITRSSGAPADLVIRGARLFDPGSRVDVATDLRIQSGIISEIGSNLAAPQVIEAAGRTLFPAFIDPHVHLRTPGQEWKETLATGTAAAAAGGFCTILAMPNTDPVVDSVEVLVALHERASREARVGVGFLATITVGQKGEQLAELGALADAGAVGFSDDGLPVRSAGMLRRALQYAQITGRVLSLHCEDPALSPNAQMHEASVSAELGLSGYPSIAEATMVARDLMIAAFERQPLHLCHLHVSESALAVRRAREDGVDVSAEASPHHLLLTHDEARSLDANRFKMSPPLAADDHRRAIVDAVRDGTIDCIATDHAPHHAAEKAVPWEAAPPGIIGLESAVPSIYAGLVVPGVLSLETVVTRMTAGPARAFGLDCPRIALGELANLALWKLDDRYVFTEADIRSKAKNSAFLGRELQGRCELTIAHGVVA